MLTGAAFTEVVDHRFHVHKRPRRIGPQVSAMCLLVAWLEHRHRRFVGMQHAAAEYLLPQGIDQGLQLHAAHAHPGAQRGARYAQAGPRKDAFLAVQR